MSEHDESAGRSGRRRGRHAAPADSTPAVGGLTAGLRTGFARAAAWLEPRRATAVAWVSKRRLPVFVVAATFATVAMLGGTIAVLQSTAPPHQADDAAPAVNTVRPTSTEREEPSTFGPILPSPGAPTTLPPLPETADPDAADATPTDSAPSPEPEPTTAPDGNGRDTAPGQTKKPDKPGG